MLREDRVRHESPRAPRCAASPDRCRSSPSRLPPSRCAPPGSPPRRPHRRRARRERPRARRSGSSASRKQQAIVAIPQHDALPGGLVDENHRELVLGVADDQAGRRLRRRQLGHRECGGRSRRCRRRRRTCTAARGSRTCTWPSPSGRRRARGAGGSAFSRADRPAADTPAACTRSRPSCRRRRRRPIDYGAPASRGVYCAACRTEVLPCGCRRIDREDPCSRTPVNARERRSHHDSHRG